MVAYRSRASCVASSRATVDKQITEIIFTDANFTNYDPEFLED
jgi:hypothetical protein